ncbi:MAG: family 43 glycosylhydrolase [Niastella sp.]|nr:family 43 glycosylhydrolase [Niastella sp.]
MKVRYVLPSLLGTLLLCFTGSAQNPVIQTVYTADPAALVHGDSVYLYTGRDEDSSTWFTMKEWRVYATADMVNWTDRGVPLSLKAFSWAQQDAWAAQCIERKGKFYFYVCVKHRQLNKMVIGVAVADKPTGPFKDAIGQPLITNSGGDIDPAVFIDDNGQAYLYWGNPNLWYVKLNEDMISYDRNTGVVQVPLNKEGFNVRYNDPKRSSAYEEAPWLYKRKGIYYLLYAAGGVPEHLAYSTSSSAEGPWQYRDTIMTVIKKGGAFTNHPALITFKENNYFFYHNGALPGGGGFNRSVCVEQFSFNDDGSIPRITPTQAGIVKPVKNLNPFRRNEAETIAWETGVETAPAADGGIYVTNISNKDYIKVRSVDFGKGAKRFEAAASTTGAGGTIEIHTGSADGPLAGTCTITSTAGNKQTFRARCKLSGVHDVYFVFKGGEGDLFDFDWWKFR